jgi:prophage antirepressor
MSKEITVFNKEEFGEVRSITIDGEPWFVGKDIAKALEYKNPERELRKKRWMSVTKG